MKISAAKATPPEVAIVGAGLSGLTCARQLATAGLFVNVFDKGRRPGGRMSTRGLDRDLSFDHGCQYFQLTHLDL
jgi:renalase